MEFFRKRRRQKQVKLVSNASPATLPFARLEALSDAHLADLSNIARR